MTDTPPLPRPASNESSDAPALPGLPDGSANEDAPPKVIAFYLPQFHPIPENDKAWGKGFTEWTNVARARPLYDGHNQPSLPAELGFYDLRIPQVMEQQASLAKEHGIHGFCYYYYWFDGRRVLEKPLEVMLQNKRVDMPFCLCWANENWTRRWDGSENDIIIAQTYDRELGGKFIEDMLPYFRDERYIHIDGRPLLLIYRAEIIPDLLQTVRQWRDTARGLGLDLYIAACLTFGFDDPPRYGFDAGVEFPPHGIKARPINEEVAWNGPFEGKAYDYAEAASMAICKPEAPFPVFRTAMAGWDNTARRGRKGNLFHDATPAKFESWLSALVIRTQRKFKPGHRLVFVNAWNEWAEGAHLEPDQKFGRQWLTACKRATGSTGLEYEPSVESHVIDALQAATAAGAADPPVLALLDILRRKDEKLRNLLSVNAALTDIYFNWLDRHSFSGARAPIPTTRISAAVQEFLPPPEGSIDTPISLASPVSRNAAPWHLSGWICCSESTPVELMQCMVTLVLDANGESVSTFADYALARTDIAAARTDLPPQNAKACGFRVYLDLRQLVPGEYTLMIGLVVDEEISYLPDTPRVFIA